MNIKQFLFLSLALHLLCYLLLSYVNLFLWVELCFKIYKGRTVRSLKCLMVYSLYNAAEKTHGGELCRITSFRSCDTFSPPGTFF